MNNCNFIGNLVRNPDLSYGKGKGTAICKFTIAVGRSFKRENEPDSDFINCVSFGKQAELIAERFTKGSKIGVTGSFRNNDYEKDGKKVYGVVIILNQDGLTFVEKKQNNNAQNNYELPQQEFDGMTPIDDGDVPF